MSIEKRAELTLSGEADRVFALPFSGGKAGSLPPVSTGAEAAVLPRRRQPSRVSQSTKAGEKRISRQ